MGRLCQVVGTGDGEFGKRIQGTDTFDIVRFGDIPKDRLKEVCYTSVVCEVRPCKKYPNRTRITICGKNVSYPRDVAPRPRIARTIQLLLGTRKSKLG